MDTIAPGLSATSPPPTKGKKVPPSSISTSNNNSTGATECGVVLSILILGLYFFGFLESLSALPEISLQLEPPRFLGKEANLNVAKDVYEVVVDSTSQTTQQQQQALPVSKQNASQKRQQQQQQQGLVNPIRIKRTTIHDVTIPVHVWPASIKKEPDRFETIRHPGDGQTTMSVPMFWSPPLHNMGLMTREFALSIGSCSVPDPKTGSYQRGDDCPVDDRTIYFAIASYRDFQCRFTVESAFGRAKNPKRIRVGTYI
jgi:Glycosyltransferase (GlcNAc)